jgi:hypothetical protein
MQPLLPFAGSWPVVLTFGLMGTFTLGLTNSGHQMCHELLSWADATVHHVEPARPVRPEVLVITRNRKDESRVALAANPRGYRVVVAGTAAQGMERLRSDANQLAVVVLDVTISGADRIATVVHTLAPKAKLIKLRPHHDAVDVSKPLIDNLSWSSVRRLLHPRHVPGRAARFAPRDRRRKPAAIVSEAVIRIYGHDPEREYAASAGRHSAREPPRSASPACPLWPSRARAPSGLRRIPA